MTIEQANGVILPYSLYCASDTNFSEIASAVPGLSPEDIGSGHEVGWRGGHSAFGGAFDYALFEAEDGSYFGFGRVRNVAAGVTTTVVHALEVVPVSRPEEAIAEMTFDTPLAEPATMVPINDATDAVAQTLAPELGMSPQDLMPYIMAAPAADMTIGDGDSERAVNVSIWLSEEKRPLSPNRGDVSPCHPDYGTVEPSVFFLQYKFHNVDGDLFVQAKVIEVYTSRIAEAFNGGWSKSVNVALRLAHNGLSPNLLPPK